MLDLNLGGGPRFLIAQLVVANEAVLAMYQKGWSQPSEFFEARRKYLQLPERSVSRYPQKPAVNSND